MGIFKKDPAAVMSQVIRDENRRTQQLPKPSAKEQQAIDGSIERGLNGTNRRKN